jgi:xylulose-5-phosphate/fructose-6-phosphate phosphoketolase
MTRIPNLDLRGFIHPILLLLSTQTNLPPERNRDELIANPWDWASNDQGCEPDLVMASAGDIPTQEALAATVLLREEFPGVKIRFINVLDLFKLQPSAEHPHGLTDLDYDSLFTVDKPIIFNFHGYPWLIHRLTYGRNNKTLHARG